MGSFAVLCYLIFEDVGGSSAGFCRIFETECRDGHVFFWMLQMRACELWEDRVSEWCYRSFCPVHIHKYVSTIISPRCSKRIL